MLSLFKLESVTVAQRVSVYQLPKINLAINNSKFLVTIEICWHLMMEISVQDPVTVSIAQLADCWLPYDSIDRDNQTN